MTTSVRAGLLSLAAAAPVRRARPGRQARRLARGHLVPGTGSTNAPWHFKSADDKLQGFDVDMGRIIAKALFGNPDKITYVNQSSDARIPNITTNKVDITCQFMTVTGERAQQVAFTIPYYREGVGLMLGRRQVRRLRRAEGSRLVRDGLGAAERLCRADGARRAAQGQCRPVRVRGPDLSGAGSGRADAVATDQSSLAWYMTQNPGRFKDAGYGWNPQTYACAVKRGDQDWLNFVNTALHEAMTGVEFDVYAKSFKTWFGSGPAAAADRLPGRIPLILARQAVPAATQLAERRTTR